MRNQDHSLHSLVLEFEQLNELGKQAYFDENTFFRLIDYYEKELFFDKALEVIEYALAQFGYSTDLHIKKAQLLLITRNSELAMNTLDQAQVIAPAEIEIQLLKAKVYASMERYAEALSMIDSLKETTHSDNNLSSIFYCEGQIFEMMRDFDGMYQILKQALLHNPLNEAALERIWVCAELTRRFDESINFHLQLIDRTPYNYLAWYNLGQAYSCIGTYDKAIEAYEYSFIINPEFEAGYKDCAELCCEMKQYKKALAHYLEALDVFGPDSDLYASIGACYLRLTNYDSAAKYLNRSLKLDPYCDEVHYYKGMCHYYKNNWEKAQTSLLKAIEIEDRREEYYLYLAKTYWHLGDNVKADYYFSKSTEIGPEQVESWKEHAFFLFKSDRISAALEILEEGIVHAMDAQLLFMKAAILYVQNNHEGAYEVLREALDECVEGEDLMYMFAPEMKHDKITQEMINYYRKEQEESTL